MVNLEELAKLIREMERHGELYKVLKRELSALGYWKNRGRGNPRLGYSVMKEKDGKGVG